MGRAGNGANSVGGLVSRSEMIRSDMFAPVFMRMLKVFWVTPGGTSMSDTPSSNTVSLSFTSPLCKVSAPSSSLRPRL